MQLGKALAMHVGGKMLRDMAKESPLWHGDMQKIWGRANREQRHKFLEANPGLMPGEHPKKVDT